MKTDTGHTQVEDKSLSQVYKLALTKQEWIVIWNILLNAPLSGNSTLSSAKNISEGKADKGLQIAFGIIDKLQPIVAQQSNKDIVVKE